MSTLPSGLWTVELNVWCHVLWTVEWLSVRCHVLWAVEIISVWCHVLWTVESLSVRCHVLWAVENISVWCHVPGLCWNDVMSLWTVESVSMMSCDVMSCLASGLLSQCQYDESCGLLSQSQCQNDVMSYGLCWVDVMSCGLLSRCHVLWTVESMSCLVDCWVSRYMMSSSMTSCLVDCWGNVSMMSCLVDCSVNVSVTSCPLCLVDFSVLVFSLLPVDFRFVPIPFSDALSLPLDLISWSLIVI